MYLQVSHGITSCLVYLQVSHGILFWELVPDGDVIPSGVKSGVNNNQDCWFSYQGAIMADCFKLCD